jgi:hypothetical protein
MIKNIVKKYLNINPDIEWINEERTRLIEICEKVIVQKNVQRDYMGKGRTHCNNGSHIIARLMKAPTRVFFSEYGFYVLRANQICDNAEKLAREGIIRELPRERMPQNPSVISAREAAWGGKVVLACAKNLKRKPGHVAILYPCEDRIMVANIGWNNLICTLEDPKGFGWGTEHYKKNYEPIRFYLLS